MGLILWRCHNLRVAGQLEATFFANSSLLMYFLHERFSRQDGHESGAEKSFLLLFFYPNTLEIRFDRRMTAPGPLLALAPPPAPTPPTRGAPWPPGQWSMALPNDSIRSGLLGKKACRTREAFRAENSVPAPDLPGRYTLHVFREASVAGTRPTALRNPLEP